MLSHLHLKYHLISTLHSNNSIVLTNYFLIVHYINQKRYEVFTSLQCVCVQVSFVSSIELTGQKFEANKEGRARDREKCMEEESTEGRQLSEQKGAFQWKLMSSAINLDIVVILSYGWSSVVRRGAVCMRILYLFY